MNEPSHPELLAYEMEETMLKTCRFTSVDAFLRAVRARKTEMALRGVCMTSLHEEDDDGEWLKVSFVVSTRAGNEVLYAREECGRYPAPERDEDDDVGDVLSGPLENLILRFCAEEGLEWSCGHCQDADWESHRIALGISNPDRRSDGATAASPRVES